VSGDSSPRIGLFGTFDLENFGDMLIARVTRRELAARLPCASIRVFAPFGYPGLNRFDGGEEPAEPLGAWNAERAAELAGELDCAVVGGGEVVDDLDELLAPHYGAHPAETVERAPSRFFIEGLGPELEEGCPVLWNAVGIPFDPTPEMVERLRDALARRPYVAVRDEISLRRLREAGVEGEIALVPDATLVMDRLLPADLLDRRLAYLRSIGAYPKEGQALVVQGDRDLIAWLDELATAFASVADECGNVPIAVVETGPCYGDDAFADALAEALPGRVTRVGPFAGVEDVAAAVVGSAGFIGSSLHGNVAAFVFGRPHVVLDLRGESKLRGFARSIGAPELAVDRPADVAKAFERSETLGARAEFVAEMQTRVDAHFDRISEIAVGSAARPGREASGEFPEEAVEESDEAARALWRAYEAQSRRLVSERIALENRVQDVQLTVAHAYEIRRRAEEETADMRVRLADKEREVENLLNLKLFRYAAPFRNAYGWLLRHLRRA